MRSDINNIVSSIESSMNLIRQRISWEDSKKRLEELNALAESTNLWDTPITAQKLMRERRQISSSIDEYNIMESDLAETLELLDLAVSEDDQDIISDLLISLNELQKRAQNKELESLLNGVADANDTFLEINSGAGGTESCDWASMVLRMYLRWAEKRGFNVELQSETLGDEVGIKSVAYKISGQNAYGWLKSESGVHRLVRISPFDSAAKRHTSFCSVWVYPVVDEDIDIKLDNSDLRIDTYRSSGAGGQHVNTTDSAVRITHMPTGIVVTSSEKSQHQNRDIAIKALKSRLYQIEIEKRNMEINAVSYTHLTLPTKRIV